MNKTLEKALELLREVSRGPADFEDLSPVAIADALREYWSEGEISEEDWLFLDKLYDSAS